MKIDLNELQKACYARGELPGCCKGCPANPDGENIPTDSSCRVLARCKLLCPRAWNISEIESACHKLLIDKTKPTAKPACYKCRFSCWNDIALYCTKTRKANGGFSLTLYEFSCPEFVPDEQYRKEFVDE